MPKVDEGVAFAALGLSVVEAMKLYMETAPSLKDLRCAPPGDFASRQLILDADMFGLIVVLAIGGGGAVLIRRWYPLLLAGAVLILLSAWHRMVLASPNKGV